MIKMKEENIEDDIAHHQLTGIEKKESQYKEKSLYQKKVINFHQNLCQYLLQNFLQQILQNLHQNLLHTLIQTCLHNIRHKLPSPKKKCGSDSEHYSFSLKKRGHRESKSHSAVGKKDKKRHWSKHKK